MASMEITTMIGCPLMCTYCPQDELREAYGKDDAKYMSLETYKTVLDKLPEMSIHFSGMAEAWVNPEATNMLRYALETGRNVGIFTTLYNWTPDTVHEVGELILQYSDQIEIVKIHYPDYHGNMRGWKMTEDWKYCLEGLTAVVRQAGVHHEAMTMSDMGVHPSIVEARLDGVKLSHGWGVVTVDRGGTVDLEKIGQKVRFQPRWKVPIKCSRAEKYDNLVLQPNGDVVLCCMDYKMQHVIGNLLTMSYDELFESTEFKRILEENAKSEFSTNTLCRSCVDACPQSRG